MHLLAWSRHGFGSVTRLSTLRYNRRAENGPREPPPRSVE
jgi:hypothetical protein